MTLTSGTRLGPYEILSPLGAGGMGEVYRAKDTRLDRIVAIKVLPAHLSSDPELKQRMEREAKAISALQHANICTLHDIGAQNGTDFLVMEYLEGQTLAERLAKGALPLGQVLKIGTEIAQALEKAHHQGIIHRDLKPANIMLTKAGAKLMDFGLAKPEAAGVSRPVSQLSPSTQTMNIASLTAAVSPLTQKGSIVGNGHGTPCIRRQIAAQCVHFDSGKRARAHQRQPAAHPADARSRDLCMPGQRSL
jgi:eukaryotic-like serine/threonine-protein kinase